MKNISGDVIYVGKAKNLKKRILQYFSNKKAGVKTEHLVSKIYDIETIVSQNELDAFLLENNLIKQYKPKYNISLKDDKSYPYIRLAKSKTGFPYIIKTRSFKKGDGEYFGPYSSSYAVTQTIKTINKIFKIRTCSDNKFNSYAVKKRPCLYYQINRCSAPCCGYIGISGYKERVDGIRLLLSGKNRQLLRELKRSMDGYVRELNFEAAIKIRDKINAITIINEKQITVLKNEKDIDAIGFYGEKGRTDVVVIIIRGGKIVGTKNFFFKNIYLNDDEMLSAFLNQYYSKSLEIGGKISDEILIPVDINIDDKNSLLSYIKQFSAKKVKIISAGKTVSDGKKNKYGDIIAMALQNAKKNFLEKTGGGGPARAGNEGKIGEAGKSREEKLLGILKDVLRMGKIPKIIECFDISNISGTYAVASKSVLNNGKKDTSLYRKYRIRSKNTPDDYAMMYEALYRRFNNAAAGKDPLPDLIMVDGGKGQLNVLARVSNEFRKKGLIDAEDMPALIAIAKAKDSGKNIETDNIYLPNRKNEVNFGKNKEAIFLLMRLRDEAHRFAVSYFSKLKRKSLVSSELLNIKGVGRMVYKNLMDSLGSVENVKNAPVNQLLGIKGVNKTVAQNIYDYFHNDRANSFNLPIK
ncbi:MAG: excinuclease ABC subunit UvrC [Deltaproteobacteria bacterium]|nr:excinuclease ABC subunit UvrC [Deltaproteobacteria bacterium]MCL5880423.1 excinuclease ABC subunit UvrC [Deltaproteobacteria bacterium]